MIKTYTLIAVTLFLCFSFTSYAQIDTTRVRNTSVYPYNAVCQLEVARRSYKRFWLKRSHFTSTGFLINSRAVLTNAHNLHSNLFSIVESIEINRAREDENLLFRSMTLSCRKKVKKHVRSASEYSFFQRASRRAKHDYAIIILPEEQIATDILPAKSATDFTLTDKQLQIIGYPGHEDPGFTNGKRQWQSNGPYVSSDAQNILYSIWTATGSSGSPLIIMADGKPSVIGIHAFTNKAVKITPGLLEEIEKWLGEFHTNHH